MWTWTLGFQSRWKGEDNRKFRQHQHLYLRHNPRVKNLCFEVKECTQKHSESELIGPEIGRTPGGPACEAPGPSKSHTRECKKHFKMSGRSRCRATADEVKRGVVEVDPDTRALDPSSSSIDVKPGAATDVENSADQMDHDASPTAPAISPNAEENVSKESSSGEKRTSHSQ